MPTPAEEIALLTFLQSLAAFADLGLTATLGERGEIIISRRGHVRGIWQCEGPLFAWTPTGYNGPVYRTPDTEGAAAYTRDVIMSSSRTIR